MFQPAQAVTVDEVLNDLGLASFLPIFKDNLIDLDTLYMLSEEHLREMNLPLGPRLKLTRFIKSRGLPAAPPSNLSPVDWQLKPQTQQTRAISPVSPAPDFSGLPNEGLGSFAVNPPTPLVPWETSGSLWNSAHSRLPTLIPKVSSDSTLSGSRLQRIRPDPLRDPIRLSQPDSPLSRLAQSQTFGFSQLPPRSNIRDLNAEYVKPFGPSLYAGFGALSLQDDTHQLRPPQPGTGLGDFGSTLTASQPQSQLGFGGGMNVLGSGTVSVAAAARQVHSQVPSRGMAHFSTFGNQDTKSSQPFGGDPNSDLQTSNGPHFGEQPEGPGIGFSPLAPCFHMPVQTPITQTVPLAQPTLSQQVHSQVPSQVSSQVPSQASSQAHSQVPSQAHSQVSSQAHSQVYSSQVSSQAQSQVYSQVPGQVHSQAPGQVHSQAHSQAHSQVYSQVHSQVSSQVSSQLYSQVPGQVHSQAHSQVYSQASQVPSQAPSQVPSQAPSQALSPVASQAIQLPSQVPNQAPSPAHDQSRAAPQPVPQVTPAATAPSSSPVSEKPGVACAVCTFINPPSVAGRCSMCNSDLPPPAAPSDEDICISVWDTALISSAPLAEPAPSFAALASKLKKEESWVVVGKDKEKPKKKKPAEVPEEPLAEAPQQHKLRPGDWVCSCGNLNWSRREVCNMCAAPAPPEALEQQRELRRREREDPEACLVEEAAWPDLKKEEEERRKAEHLIRREQAAKAKKELERQKQLEAAKAVKAKLKPDKEDAEKKTKRALVRQITTVTKKQAIRLFIAKKKEVREAKEKSDEALAATLERDLEIMKNSMAEAWSKSENGHWRPLKI